MHQSTSESLLVLSHCISCFGTINLAGYQLNDQMLCSPIAKLLLCQLHGRSNANMTAAQIVCRIFTLAKERDLDLDFHVDENGNERAKGLLYIAHKAIEHGYQGRVVCGHCWYALPTSTCHCNCVCVYAI